MWWLVITTLPYLALFLFFWNGLRKTGDKNSDTSGGKKQDQVSPAAHQTRISVVISAHNEMVNLPVLLNDLTSVDYPRELLEIIFIDDNSTDSTYEILRSASDKSDIIKVLTNKSSGKKEALMTAFEQVTGDLIITTDADCRIGRDWIKLYADFYNINRCDLIIGPVDLTVSPGISGKFCHLEFLSLQAVTAGAAAAGHPVMCNGANLGFRPDITDNWVNSINPEIASGDDMFLLQYAKRSGRKILYLNNDKAIVETRCPGSLSSFIRQRSRWAGKNIRFRDREIYFTAAITLFTNLLLSVMIVLSIINPQFILPAISIYLCKSLPDFLLLSEIGSRRGKRNLLLYFVPLQIIYPFYIVITSVIGIFGQSRW
ncbi:MAG TPA: glycosyltransferase [Bacteroidales bacterium]|nr:glycosyltransferase [Bacteroidales bacterium]